MSIDVSRRLFVGFVAMLAVAPAAVSAAQAADAPTMVFAAASMKNALDAVVADYTKATGKQVTVSYAASGALAKQLEAGAPADIFVSANVKWFDDAIAKKSVDPASRIMLAGNSLVVVTANESSFTFDGKDLASTLGDHKFAMGEPKSVPAGSYTVDALKALKQWDAVEPKVVYAENVRAALELVARGEALAGSVYGTDAKAEPRVKVVYTFPESTHEPVEYPAGLTPTASADGKAFFKYMTTPEAKALLQAQGFTTP